MRGCREMPSRVCLCSEFLLLNKHVVEGRGTAVCCGSLGCAPSGTAAAISHQISRQVLRGGEFAAKSFYLRPCKPIWGSLALL